jgi:hypothetical protein
MGSSHRVVAALVALWVVAVATPGARAAGDLDDVVQTVAKDALTQFEKEKLKENDFSISVIDLSDPAKPRSGSYRGDVPTFPASVVKLFYLVRTQQMLEEGKLAESDELKRTMRDMIVESSNDATAAIVDAITDAPNGMPLPEAEMTAWSVKRNSVNRYYASLGFPVGGEHGINVCQKTYCEGPYGRERVFLGPKYENRNKLTTDATAKLLSQVVMGQAVNAERSKRMMELLKRDPATKPQADSQDTDFSARGLPDHSKLWSKAGWTSTARHDAAYVELPDGRRLILVTFTTGHANQRQILPAIAKRLVAAVGPAESRK